MCKNNVISAHPKHITCFFYSYFWVFCSGNGTLFFTIQREIYDTQCVHVAVFFSSHTTVNVGCFRGQGGGAHTQRGGEAHPQVPQPKRDVLHGMKMASPWVEIHIEQDIVRKSSKGKDNSFSHLSKNFQVKISINKPRP